MLPVRKISVAPIFVRTILIGTILIGTISVGTVSALPPYSNAVVFTQAGNADSQSSAQAAVPSPRPQMVRVSGGVMLGMVERKSMPVYPDEAMVKGIQGDVIFKIEVDETGKIALILPVEGNPLLVAASVDGLRSFRFRPYLLNGAPIGVETQLGYHFSLQKNADAINGHVECITSLPDRAEFRTGIANDEGVLVLDPQKISGPAPQLPPELADKSGSVYLKITIGADGRVQDVKVIGGDEAFIGPVVAAVKQDVYEPRLVDGKPSVATTEASYHVGPGH